MRDGRERAEESVLLFVNAGGKEQGVHGSCAGAVAEAQCPESFNGDRKCVWAPEKTLELPGSRVKGGKATAAEVSHQQVMAALTEIGWGEYHSPGRILPPSRSQAHQQVATATKGIDE